MGKSAYVPFTSMDGARVGTRRREQETPLSFLSVTLRAHPPHANKRVGSGAHVVNVCANVLRDRKRFDVFAYFTWQHVQSDVYRAAAAHAQNVRARAPPRFDKLAANEIVTANTQSNVVRCARAPHARLADVATANSPHTAFGSMFFAHAQRENAPTASAGNKRAQPHERVRGSVGEREPRLAVYEVGRAPRLATSAAA